MLLLRLAEEEAFEISRTQMVARCVARLVGDDQSDRALDVLVDRMRDERLAQASVANLHGIESLMRLQALKRQHRNAEQHRINIRVRSSERERR